jgi:hypothetical protein
MRKDVGAVYTMLRVLPGTYSVQGDPDLHITFHSSWPDARDAFVAAVTKEKYPDKKYHDIARAAGATSARMTEQGLRNYSRDDLNTGIVTKYTTDYALGLMALAYANGLFITFGTKVYFLAGADELSKVLDDFETFRFKPPLTPKEARAGALTEEELKNLFEKYGVLDAPASVQPGGEDPAAL